MKVDELVAQARDVVHVKRVFGEPYEKDGLTIIPAASVMGGGGGGTGQDPQRGEGEGGGVGMVGRPVGAFVIRGGDVSWRPAVDANRAMVVAGAIVVVWLLTRPFRGRARGRRAAT